MVKEVGDYMANNNETTTTFNVDISQLKKGIQDAKRQISLANSEFKAISSSMEDWQHSTEGLQAKLNQLRTTLTAQRTILSNLEQQYEAVVRAEGEGSAGAERLKIAINNQQTAINRTQREIDGYSQSLDDLNNGTDEIVQNTRQASNGVDDLGDSAKDAEGGFTILKGAIATFAGNVLTSFVGGIKDGIGALAGLAEETREYRTDMAKLETAFTSAGFKTEQATATYKDFYALLGDEGQATEAVNHLAKLTNNQKDLSTWTDIATGVYATFGDSLPIEGLTEASNETAKVGTVTGSLADALNWAGVSEDEFNEKLEKCNSEQERQALIRDTLNGLYSKSAKEYEKNNKSVMEANRANSDYMDTLATMGERIEPVTTAVKKGFTELLNEALRLVEDVDMGEFTKKIGEAFTILTNDVLPAVKDGLGWIIDNKDTLIAGLAGIASGFVAFNVASTIMSVVSAFQAFKVAQEGATVAQWLLNVAMNANPILLLVTVIATVVGAIITFIATNDNARAKFLEVWGAIKDGFFKIVDGIVNFFTETIPETFNKAIAWIKANWTTILAFLINPFAGLFKYFYDNNSKFKEFVDNAIKYIKELPVKVWKWLLNTIEKVNNWRKEMSSKALKTASDFISNIVKFISKLPSKIWNYLVNVITKITTWGSNMVSKAISVATSFVNSIVNKLKSLPSQVWEKLKLVLTKVVNLGNDLKNKAIDAGKKLATGLLEKIKGLPTDIKDIGKNIVTGLWTGINDKFTWLTTKIKGFTKDVTGKLKDFFGIHSPSRVMRDEIGKYLSLGIAEGITKNKDAVNNAMKNLASEVSNPLNLGVANAKRGLVSGTKSNGNVNGGNNSTNNNYTFNQYNNSPKALSRLEIYRQTKNQLNFAKGV